MKIRLWTLCFALAVFSALPAAPQNIPSAHAENLHSCVEGFSECNYARLNPQENQAVQTIQQQNNFMDCFDGFSDCDKKRLSTAQLQEVASVRRIRNLQNCAEGLGECDRTLLNQASRSCRPCP